jgi:nitrate/nitrite transport system ATP-binding protein
MTFLSLTNVTKNYAAGGEAHRVLHDINLQIREGEFVAILGFSGTGKTTLISILSGLVPADSGSVQLRGRPITGPGTDRGVIFQNYSLLPWLTVRGNIRLAVDQAMKGRSRGDREAWIDACIAKVRLTAAAEKRPRELSGGMRQRVAVARALALNPEVLLMDEPFGALDALTRSSLQREVESIWRSERKTVAMITNDVDEALLLADRIVILVPGPPATLGPEFEVDLARPRDRKELNHDARFIALRNEITRVLISHSPARRRTAEAGPVRSAAPAWIGKLAESVEPYAEG